MSHFTHEIANIRNKIIVNLRFQKNTDNMRKFNLLFIAAAVISFGLAGCGNKKDKCDT